MGKNFVAGHAWPIRLLVLGGGLGVAGCVGVAGPVAPPAPPPTVRGAVVNPGQPYSATCYAGIYVCPMKQSVPVRTPCSCPGLGAPSYGVAQ